MSNTDLKLPLEQVKNLRSRGMNNNQIIQELQKQGYPSQVIFEILNQSDMDNFTGFDSTTEKSNMFSDAPTSSMNAQPGIQKSSLGYSSSSDEIIEAIIEEKWNELVKDLDKIIEWKNVTANRITSIEQKFEDLRREFDKIHSSILGKIEEYDKNIVNVGAEVKAMEKVFSKVLPVFTENVAELSRISRELKK